jgi:glycosyltransferase involved in cell wall biosynthesis
MLFSTVVAMGAPREAYALVSQQAGPLLDLDGFPRQRILTVPSLPELGTGRDFDGGDRDRIDGLLHSSMAATVNPDIIHVSHVFEGFGERVALPNPASRPAGQVLSATLYDLIPLRFPHHYFTSAHFEKWYRRQVQWLRQADLLLSISDASKQDAVSLLGIDPERIVTIHLGVSECYKPDTDLAARALLLHRHGINRKNFILYTGGDDYRKNIRGAIQGYAALPKALRDISQMVIVCAIEEHSKEMFWRVARESGLGAKDILFLGFIPEEDLIGLYSACTLFIFPSLYEGFGLPVLEAMACGAPVIGGNNSSIKELIARADSLFDAADPASITASVAGILENPALAGDLRRHGLARAKDFTWENTGRRAIAAFDDALRRKREAGARAASWGWLPRRSLAILTPLPPSKSGIADYSAQFLPYLAEHFDIDVYIEGDTVSDKGLNSAFRIFHERDFRANATSYGSILYEFGNSEFHSHMVALLDEFPGIVSLHDAFLSGLMGYFDFCLGEKGRYAREMLSAHGSQARHYLAPVRKHHDAVFSSMVDLPCIKYVLDRAVGLISHSPFNLETARRFHPEGWPGPFKIIPQPAVPPEPWTQARRAQARAALGFGSEDIVIASFGHVSWTKLNDQILEAFLQSPLARDRHCHLIFAGELAQDDFGNRLAARIEEANLGGRIKVTGFLPEAEYQTYLRCADIAIQLRTKSRGGTPRGVLDCLAFGVPAIVNDEASYRDYPEDAVYRLPQNPSVDDIANALGALRREEGLRALFAGRGLDHARAHHHPKHCAAQYAAAIHEFTDRYQNTHTRNNVRRLAPLLAAVPESTQACQQMAAFLDVRPRPSFTRPRLLIDVSYIEKQDAGTGIPRTVREIVRNAYCRPRPGLDCMAVFRVGDQLFEATDWLATLGAILPHEENPADRRAIELRTGDQLLMLDSSWGDVEQFKPIFQRARQTRVPITSTIYDLLPLILPSEVVPGGADWFGKRIRLMIEASDSILCISRAVADNVLEHMERQGLGRPGLKVGYWHLGSDFDASQNTAPQGTPIASVPDPYCLMVGTIEPRKNYVLALTAFERLWEEGSPLNLVIAGRPGWMMEQFIARVNAHPLLNRRLFFFEGPSDAEIDQLYRHARVLLLASKGEGFGLPLIEAAHRDTPIICSDIPVFREIAGDHATYVTIESAPSLAREITAWWERSQKGDCPQSSRMRILTWAQSLEMLLDVLINANWYKTRN